MLPSVASSLSSSSFLLPPPNLLLVTSKPYARRLRRQVRYRLLLPAPSSVFLSSGATAGAQEVPVPGRAPRGRALCGHDRLLHHQFACVSHSRASDDVEGRMVDTRLGIMTVISIIPYFNWLSWTFAWLDSGKSRYLVCSLVYLAPYFRTISCYLHESWLPIASILLCIIHIQLEISIRHGDIDGFLLSLVFKNMFKESQQQVDRTHRKVSKKDSGSKKGNSSLPSAKDEQREQLRDWEIPQKNKVDQVNWGENVEEERKQ